MKIIHACLIGPYTDNYGYQENVLSKMHKLQGYDVYILASTKTWLNGSKIGDTNQKTHFTKEGIPVTRLSYVKWFPHFIVNKLRIFKGIKDYLLDIKPDIIFIHGVQFLGIMEFIEYKKKYNTIIYVDNHADFINSAKNIISRNILHRILYKYCAKKIEPYTRKFYGTLPTRVDFLERVYDLPKHKLELLLMGIDDTLVDTSNKATIYRETRKKYNICPNEFLIVTGGKIDRLKNVHSLIKIFNELNNKHLKLIIFGSLLYDVKNDIEGMLLHSNNVIFVGWQSAIEIYNIFLASDLAVFPGKHSVLWEQAVGLGLPCIFKKWDGHQHVDIGGNCMFIDDSDEQSIKEALIHVTENNKMYKKMKLAASKEGKEDFSYCKISRYAIEQ